MDAPVVKVLGSTHFDDSGLYITSEEKIFPVLQAVNEFLNIEQSLPLSKPAPSSAMRGPC